MRYRYATPEERAEAEDAQNRDLAIKFGSQHRVCVHPDRTSTWIPGGGYRVECDYCPAYSEIQPGGIWPDIEQVYYEDLL